MQESEKSTQSTEEAKRLIDAWNTEAWNMINEKPDAALALTYKARHQSQVYGYEEGILQSRFNVWAYFRNEARLRDAALFGNAFEEIYAALDLARKLGDTASEARALRNIGLTHDSRNESAVALKYYEQSLAILLAQEHTEKIHLAWTYTNFGGSYLTIGDYERALEYFLKGMSIFEELGDKSGQSSQFVNIGVLYANIGETGKALECYFKALAIKEELGEESICADILQSIGIIYEKMVDYATSIDYLLRALAIYQKHENLFGKATINNMIGSINVDTNNDSGAMGFFSLAVEQFTKIDHREGIAFALNNIAGVETRANNFEQAINLLMRSRELFKNIPHFQGEAFALYRLGKIFFAQGKLEQSNEYFKESLSLFVRINHREHEPMVRIAIGENAFALKDYTIALDYYQSTIESAEKFEGKRWIALAQKNMADCFAALNDFQNAYKHGDIARLMEREIFQKEADERLKKLQVLFETKKAEQEREIFRLRNVELSEALDKVKTLNEHLKKLNEEKNEFLGIAAHDLKNPLSGIHISASMVKWYSARLTPQNIERQMDSICSTVDQMLAIISNLLDVNAIESGITRANPENFEITALMEKLVNFYSQRASEKNITFASEIQPQSVVFADKIFLREIMDNLISNAVKYSSAGDSVLVRVKSSDYFIRFEVQDSGPGLSDEDKKLLFGKFTRLSARPTGDESSTGLGLSIVKKMVEMMNGRVWCESELGKGAKFIVQLPLSED